MLGNSKNLRAASQIQFPLTPPDAIYVTVAWLTSIPQPVALTRRAWKDCVEWPETKKLSIESERLRAEELVFHAGQSYGKWASALSAGKQVDFEIRRIPADGSSSIAEEVSLRMWISLGRAGEKVLLIALAAEVQVRS